MKITSGAMSAINLSNFYETFFPINTIVYFLFNTFRHTDTFQKDATQKTEASKTKAGKTKARRDTS